ncbi:MAG: DUF3347 domain-containing protein [Cytophagaceae bacterium]
MKNWLLIILLLSISCFSFADEKRSSISIEENISKADPAVLLRRAYREYLELKEALVNADPSGAKMRAGRFNRLITRLQKQDDHPKYDTLIQLSGDIIKSLSLDEQRELFSELSLHFIPIIRNSHIDVDAFVNYCRMALDEKGAYWLSESEEIRNPYFGYENLRCGEIVEEI